MSGLGIYVIIIVGAIILLWILLYFIPIGLWFQALVSGVRISLLQLIFMRWRKVPPSDMVGAMIEADKAGIKLNRDELEAHYLAGGHVAAGGSCPGLSQQGKHRPVIQDGHGHRPCRTRCLPGCADVG